MYGKYIKNGYIIGISTGTNTGEAITEEEYKTILDIIENRPQAEDGYTYRLTTSLDWVLEELPPIAVSETEIIESEDSM